MPVDLWLPECPLRARNKPVNLGTLSTTAGHGKRQLTFVLHQVGVDFARDRLPGEPFQRVVAAAETRLGEDSDGGSGERAGLQAEVVQLFEADRGTRGGAQDERVREEGVLGQVLPSLELAAAGVGRALEALHLGPFLALVGAGAVRISRYKSRT